MIIQGQCQVCGGTVEFDAEQRGQTAECPTCRRITVLQETPRPKSFRLFEPNKDRRLRKCKECGGLVGRSADKCPHCGADATTIGHAVAAVIAGLLLAGLIWWLLF